MLDVFVYVSVAAAPVGSGVSSCKYISNTRRLGKWQTFSAFTHPTTDPVRRVYNVTYGHVIKQ
jgi:hypothetical protein